jgi:sec-independent protein translocase protein TatA|tara:strand:- start:61 stop:270 length:210 start_codon:yes stop_codon:yes gene_type:complete
MFESLTLFLPAGMEFVWIIVIVGVLLFGAKKIPELAKTLGKAKGEYKKGEIEGDKELKDLKEKSDEKTS